VGDLSCDVGLVFCLALRVIEQLTQLLEWRFAADSGLKTASVLGPSAFAQAVMCCIVTAGAMN
jgi:hypothetical protein